MDRWDAEYVGTVVMLVSVGVVLLAALAGTVLGVDVGRYGSPPVGSVFAAIGLTGVVLAMRSAADETTRTVLRGGSMGCLAATIVLLNPLPSTFGQVALVGGGLAGIGGSVSIAAAGYRHVVPDYSSH